MGVSTSGGSGRSLARLTAWASLLTVLAGTGFYLYGPPVTPALRAGAEVECNRLTGGSYRGYDLSWVVSARPHWACADRSMRGDAPRNLGWWVDPDLWGLR